MPEPNNYMLPASAPQNPGFQGFAQGFSLGNTIGDTIQARQDRETQQKAQAQAQAELSAVAQNPTVAGINQLMLKYPAIADKFKPALESATDQQKQSRIGQASDVYAALLANRPEIAKSLLEEQATAAKNAGDEQGSKHASVMAQLLDSDAGAKTLLGSTGMYLSSAMGPEKFAETYSKLETTARANEKAPAERAKAEADAKIAGSKAKYADSQAAAELAKAGWDVEKIQSDIQVSREASRIAAMNAALARETNDLKRQELGLKVQEAQDKHDTLIRERASEVTSAQATIDNMLSTAQQALNTPKSVIWAAAGPIASKLPTAAGVTADFEEALKTLGSQSFLSQVKSMKGMGSLSDAEGKKLEAGLQNLSLRQSPDRLVSNIKEIQRLMLKARDGLTEKYGAPGKPSELRPGVAQKTITVDF